MIDLTFKNDVTTSAGITVIVREPAPVIPDNPPVVIPDPTPSNPTNPTDNVEPKPEEPAVPETPDNSDENENVQPKAQDNGEVKQHKSAKKTVVNAPVKVASVKSEKALKASLPQTGDSQNQLGLIGLALAAVAGLFGIASERKRKN